jgi:hypothetical protein
MSTSEYKNVQAQLRQGHGLDELDAYLAKHSALDAMGAGVDLGAFVVQAALGGGQVWVMAVIQHLAEKVTTSPEQASTLEHGLSMGWLNLLSVISTKTKPPLTHDGLLDIAKIMPSRLWKQDTTKSTIKNGVWNVVDWINDTQEHAFSGWHLSKKNMANTLYFDRLNAWQQRHPESVGFLSAVTMRWNQMGREDIVAWAKNKYHVRQADWVWLNEGWGLADPLSSFSKRDEWRSFFENKALKERHQTTIEKTSNPRVVAL